MTLYRVKKRYQEAWAYKRSPTDMGMIFDPCNKSPVVPVWNINIRTFREHFGLFIERGRVNSGFGEQISSIPVTGLLIFEDIIYFPSEYLEVIDK